MSAVILVYYCGNPAKLTCLGPMTTQVAGFLDVRSLGVGFENHVIFSPGLIHH
ncbi:hypothetical protein Golob_003833 [Gossypium lobatum]|uniref:Uncharacterized protein n=1 Tax=Gossypium lobatum TaxID=34289 RepID=A0A7J8MZN9_9ROSI|nr:hypothetical protein [Gossypium lobatum]